MTTPNLQLPEVPEAIQNASDEINEGFRALDAIVQLSVLDKDLTVPPVNAVQGDRYIVASGGSGAWLNWDRSVAFLAPDGWRRYIPRSGWVADVRDEDRRYRFVGTEWTQTSELPPDSNVVIQLSCSDLVSNLETGDNKAYVRAPLAFTLTEIRASLLVASSSGDVSVDLNKNGTPILSSSLVVDQGDLSSETSLTAAVISDSAIADDNELTIDIIQSGTGAKGLIVTLIGAAA